MSVAANLLTAGLVVVAGLLAVVATRAALHAGTHRVRWLAAGFGLMAVKGIVLAIGLFSTPDWNELLVPTIAIDLGALACFYLAVLHRPA